MQKLDTKRVTMAGLIAAIYTATSLVTFPVASGAIQFRVSEALCLLPLLLPECVIALTAGCVLSNLITGCAILDVVFGSVVTLIAAILTRAVGTLIKSTALKLFVGGIFPVALNAFILPLIWLWCYGAFEYMYYLQVIFLLVSQSVAVYGLGVPLFIGVRKIVQKKQNV